ncbi:MAG: lipopolysaccharide biosynthesis protein [Rhizobiales bacterium]|nr:lipopolysaccharide biosynthesis protein [Hyphomicrobiales bacterium]
MAPDTEIPSDGELDLGAVGRALWRKKLWVIGPALLVALLTFVAVNMMTPRYKSEARLLIEGRESVFFRPEADKNGDREARTVDAEAITSQVQLILSREVAQQVIKELKLNENPEFDPVLRGFNPIRQMMMLVGLARNPLRMTPEERVLEAYYDRISAFSVDKSRVVAAEFQSSNPELAARAANAIADAYLRLQQSVKQDQTKAASKWLAGEIETLRSKVSEAEAKVENFRAKSNLFVGTNNTTLRGQQLGELNSQFAVARAHKAELDAKARLVREMLKSGRPIESSDILNSELMRRLGEQRVTLRAQLAEQSSTLLDRHPRIKELKAQIADLDKQIRLEANKVARSIENDALIAKERVDQLTASLDQLKRQSASTNDEDVQLRGLEREAKAQRDLLESYLAKYREATARESLGAAPADARIISPAVVSNTPYFPKKLPIVLIATLATLLLATGFIVTGELLAGNVFRTEPEPVAPGEGAAEASAEPKAAVAGSESFQNLMAQIEESGEAARRVTVIGLADVPSSAKVAIALARNFATRHRVALVDVAVNSPSVAAISNDHDAPGLAELLRGNVSFSQIITRDHQSRVHVISAGEAGTDSEALIASERLSIAMDALARTYDHVMIDAGSISGVPLRALSRLGTYALLVAADPASEAIQTTKDALSAAGFKHIVVFDGVVPDQTNPPADDMGMAAA